MRILRSTGLVVAFAATATPQVIKSASVSSTSAILAIDMLPPMRLRMPASEPPRTGAPCFAREASTQYRPIPMAQKAPSPVPSVTSIRKPSLIVIPWAASATIAQPPPGYKIEDETSPFTIQIPR